jgi:HAD superfamily phosphoserine phosphatase-like hydrolase
MKSHGRKLRYALFFYLHLPSALAARAGLVNVQRYRELWFKNMTWVMRGVSPAEMEALSAHIADALWRARRTNVVAELVEWRAQGARLLVASGAYQRVTELFAERLGAEAIGTPVEVDAQGRATGRLAGPVSTGTVKAERVRTWLDGDVLAAAYGDTEGDIPMLSLAQQPVAAAPDATLRAKASANGWRILER